MEQRENQGYVITDSVHIGEVEFVVGESPKAPSPFATWQCRDGNDYRWENGRYLPQPGDVIFFDWNTGGGQDGKPDHVGIVERVEGGVIYTIEGNSGNQCRENRYAVGNYQIYGYGVVS